MSETYQENLNKISSFFGKNEGEYSLDSKLDGKFDSNEQKEKASALVLEFISYFDMFKGLKALMDEVSGVIDSTFEICENLDDFSDLLVKSILLRIIEIYIDNSPYSDKEKILKTLSQSFEILAPSALIINLGLMVKPIFSDPDYIARKSAETQVMVKEIDNSEIARDIKANIDRWIKMQDLNPEFQDELTDSLKVEVERLSQEKELINKEEITQIVLECQEMMNMQLTAISLMMDFGDEDLSPQPIS
jgi:hypothetical protein